MVHGVLDVHAVAARDLKKTKLIGKINPYLTMRIDQIKQRTQAHSQTNDPSFNEHFKFDIIDGQDKLYLELFDDKTGPDAEIGTAVVDLSKTFASGTFDAWVQLQRPHTGQPSGEVRLVLQFFAMVMRPPIGTAMLMLRRSMLTSVMRLAQGAHGLNALADQGVQQGVQQPMQQPLQQPMQQPFQQPMQQPMQPPMQPPVYAMVPQQPPPPMPVSAYAVAQPMYAQPMPQPAYTYGAQPPQPMYAMAPQQPPPVFMAPPAYGVPQPMYPTAPPPTQTFYR
nr:hypothetical protein HK105_000527 [Polyrhizophydium stewartii]